MEQNTKVIDNHGNYNYPWKSIVLAIALILVVPFTSRYLTYISFALCFFRLIKYDETIFAVDYCALVTVDMLFRTPGGDAMLSYLGIVAILWYFLHLRIKGDLAFIVLLILSTFLLLRMGTEINKMVLCVSQLVLLLFLISKQNRDSVHCACMTFCICLVTTSFFALLTRHTIQMKLFLGKEAYAIWGSSYTRFQGLFRDTNYYMSLLILAIALIIKLRVTRQVNKPFFAVIFGACSLFGFLTYSKTFLVIFVFLLCCYIGYQFFCRKYVWGASLLFGAGLAVWFSLRSDTSYLAVILNRLHLQAGLDGITTGRVKIFEIYSTEIMKDFQSMLFGKGMGAPMLGGKDPHNLFLEITYICGLVGLLLFVIYFIALAQKIQEQVPQAIAQPFFLKYYVVIVLILLFCTLHGVFSAVTYVKVYLTVISLVIYCDDTIELHHENPALKESVLLEVEDKR